MTGPPSRDPEAELKTTGRFAVALFVSALAVPAAASAVPISVPKIGVNDGYTLIALGRVWSPPSASNCTALVRAQLQVPSYYGWRVVRAVGRHRVNVCEDGATGWTHGDVYVRMRGMERLRSQPARLCWQATQTVNGRPSKHSACKRFYLRGG